MRKRTDYNPGYYILKDGQPTLATVEQWEAFMQEGDDNRRIAWTKIGEVAVSTVFLWFDHSWGYESVPLFFETMIFGGKHDGYQERYSTLEEAMQGHERAIAIVKGDTNDGH